MGLLMISINLDGNQLTKLMVFVFISFLIVFNLIPVIWMVSTSLKPKSEIYQIPINLFPIKPVLMNYIEVVTNPRMIKYFMNSVFISLSSSGLCIVLGILAGYGFSRYDFPGKKILLSYILFSMVLPRAIIIIPLYLLMVSIKAQGTYFGIIFSYIVVSLPLSIWLFTSFFHTIPKSIEDAARIDGCNTISLLWRVVVPLVKPAVFAVFIYSFVLSWNEYLLPLVIGSEKTAPITMGLMSYKGQFATEWGLIMAAACLMTIPTIVLFSAFMKHLAAGLTAGAVKG